MKADIGPDDLPTSLAKAVMLGMIEGKKLEPLEDPVVSSDPGWTPDIAPRAAARTRDELRARALADLSSPHRQHRYLAAVECGSMRLAESVDGLARLVRRGEPCAVPAIRSLGLVGGDRAAAVLARAYGRMDDVRLDIQIVAALGLTGSRVALKPLRRTLADDRVLVRMAAARSLGALGLADAAAYLRPVLLQKDVGPALKVTVAASLAQLGDAEALAHLERAVMRGGPGIQQVAIEGLAAFVASKPPLGASRTEIRKSAAVRLIAGALGSPYPEVWSSALVFLAGMRPLDARPVIDALAEHGSPEIALRARLAGAALGVGDAAATISAALVASDTYLRAAACEVAAAIGAQGTVDSVARALRDAHPMVRLAAARALGRIGGQISVNALRAAIGEADPALRHAIGEALAALAARGQAVGVAPEPHQPQVDAPVACGLALERVVAGAGGELYCMVRAADGTLHLVGRGETLGGCTVDIVGLRPDGGARVLLSRGEETFTLELPPER